MKRTAASFINRLAGPVVLGAGGVLLVGAVLGLVLRPVLPRPAVAGFECLTPPAGDGRYPGMVWVPGGDFVMGAEYAYREEGPAHERAVAGFWMDRHEVSNRRFAAFVEATGYRTLAERGLATPDGGSLRGSAVFDPAAATGPAAPWWRFQSGADWRHPEGPGSSLEGREDHPVVHVAWEDAQAYARWAGRELPSEAQFEYAAQSSARGGGDQWLANTWQGFFPFEDRGEDGFSGTAPAGCYPANALGLHDLVGNVWEWTSSPYYASHDFPDRARYPRGHDPAQPGEAVAVIKGGSFLCAPNYCLRYRPEARQGQSLGLGSSHIGFRTVLNP